VDRRPAAIARCASPADVAAAVDAFLARGDSDGGGDPALLPYAGLQSYGGAVAEVGDDQTAFGHRRNHNIRPSKEQPR
jgi:hypothetical protein